MQASDRHLLRHFRAFDANKRDVIREILVARYGATQFDFSKGENDARSVGSLLRLREVDVGYLSFSHAAAATFPAPGFYRQIFATAGGGCVAFGTKEFEVNAQSTGVVPFDAASKYDYNRGNSQIIFRVAETAIRRKLAALTGRVVGKHINFAVSDTFTNPRQQRLWRFIQTFVHEVDDHPDLSDFTREEFAELLIVKFLLANRHNWSSFLERTPLDTASHHVRAIEEYIEANWDQPLTIEILSTQTGVAARTIFATFNKMRGYTPMAFLQSVRLRRAREMLQSADPGNSVISVSLKCGFQNAGHFARYYKNAFGELPSVTLAIARTRQGRAN